MTARPSFLGALPLLAATALTSWLTLLSWRGFTVSPSEFLGPLLITIPLVSLAGAAARTLRLPVPLVAAIQLLAIVEIVNVGWGSSLLPTPDSIATAVDAFDAAGTTIAQFSSPVPNSAPPITIILVSAGLLLHLLVDLCALTLRRTPLAGLGLLAIYTVSVSVLDGAVSATAFLLGGAGFLLMLALHEGLRVGHWGRPFGRPGEAGSLGAFGTHDARRHPIAIGASALIAAVLLPFAIPTFGFSLLSGSGDGPGDNQVKITNPMTDLHRDLQRKEDVPLLQIDSRQRPSYFRIAALTQYTGAAWTPGDRDLPAENAATGRVPLPTGLSGGIERSTTPMRIQATSDFDSLWLPTPLRAAEVDAGDDWRYDDDILDFHTADNDVTTENLDYELLALNLEIQGSDLDQARPAPSDLLAAYASTPTDLPPMVSELAEAITADLPNPYQQAVALQRWFRDPANFTYSLTPDTQTRGSGNDALVHFLSSEGRVGYCEQFASAMAVMARSLGMPARVSVGLLNSTRIGTDRWQFSSHDLHAWPEIYFPGTGWVAFEPTPQSRETQAPDYTLDPIDEPGEIELPTAVPSETAPTQRPSQSADAAPAPQEPAAAAQSDADEGTPWVPILIVVLVVAALLLAAVTPRLLRRRRSEARWRAEHAPAEAGWNELRDACLDLAIPWPAGRSPREAGAQLVAHFASPADTRQRPRTGAEAAPDAAAALHELIEAVEQSRYAPAPDQRPREVIEALVEQCVRAVRAGVSPRARRRAVWLPRSLWRSPRPAVPVTTSSAGHRPADDAEYEEHLSAGS